MVRALIPIVATSNVCVIALALGVGGLRAVKGAPCTRERAPRKVDRALTKVDRASWKVHRAPWRVLTSMVRRRRWSVSDAGDRTSVPQPCVRASRAVTCAVRCRVKLACQRVSEVRPA